ncbi:uncharacterized protein [Nicotiana tomentosiformis]|uniref:uncharacterized protein n=1 Tax=Nicotiana tomentosiformis TaxID=4098 RepID=UPI00388C3D80
MAMYEALYRRLCHSPVGWFEPSEARLLGTDLVCDSLEKVKLIQEKLHKAQFGQKSYADRKVRDVAFMEGEKVLLRVLPIKGMIIFGKNGKLSPQYIGPFDFRENKPYDLDLSSMQLDGNLAYEEESAAILDRQVRMLRSKKIASVKDQWRDKPVEEETRKTEHDIRGIYPHLFGMVGLVLRRFKSESEHLSMVNGEQDLIKKIRDIQLAMWVLKKRFIDSKGLTMDNISTGRKKRLNGQS